MSFITSFLIILLFSLLVNNFLGIFFKKTLTDYTVRGSPTSRLTLNISLKV